MFKFKNIPKKDCPNTAPAASTCPVIYFPVVPGLPYRVMPQKRAKMDIDIAKCDLDHSGSKGLV